MYTTDVHEMYKSIYKICPTFRQTSVYILYTKLKGLWQPNFVYKMDGMAQMDGLGWTRMAQMDSRDSVNSLTIFRRV